MSNSFSSENRIFIVSSLFENVFVPRFENVFLFSLCSSVRSSSTIFFYSRRSRSFFNIRRTLVREIFSSRANFRLVIFFFRFKRRFTFLIDSFVRMVGERACGCRQFDRTSFTDHFAPSFDYSKT